MSNYSCDKVKSFKRRVFKLSDKVICYICEKPLTEKQATVDHFIPLHFKGEDRLKNYEICCRDCNQDKGYKNPNSFLKSQRWKNRIPDNIRYG